MSWFYDLFAIPIKICHKQTKFSKIWFLFSTRCHHNDTMIFLILGAVQICLQHDIDIPRRIRNLLEFSGTKSSKTSVHLDSFLLHLKNYFDFCIERFFYVCNYHHVYLFIFCKKIKYIISINIVDEMTSFFSLCNGPNLGNRLYISLYIFVAV